MCRALVVVWLIVPLMAWGQATAPSENTAATRPAETAPALLSSGINQATRITLKLKDVAQQQVFEEITRQAGNSFTTHPANFWQRSPGQPVSVDWDNKPFWLAMRDVCGKGNLSLKHPIDSSNPVIILARDNQDWTNYPAVTSGAFLVNLIGLHRSATVDMRRPGEIQRQFYAKFTLFVEPRIRLLRGSINAKVEAATDDKGNHLTAPVTDVDAMNFVTSWVYNIEAKLTYPKDAGTKVNLLRCSAKFIAQTRSETININNPLEVKNSTHPVAGRKVTIREIRRGAEEWEAVVTFARDGLPPEQWAGALFPGNSLKLIDGENREIRAHGFGLGTKGEEASYIFKFEKDGSRAARFGKPIKLTWEIPTETVTIPVMWEFKDLPLP